MVFHFEDVFCEVFSLCLIVVFLLIKEGMECAKGHTLYK